MFLKSYFLRTMVKQSLYFAFKNYLGCETIWGKIYKTVYVHSLISRPVCKGIVGSSKQRLPPGIYPVTVVAALPVGRVLGLMRQNPQLTLS